MHDTERGLTTGARRRGGNGLRRRLWQWARAAAMGARLMDGSGQGPHARGGSGLGLGCWWRTAREVQGGGGGGGG